MATKVPVPGAVAERIPTKQSDLLHDHRLVKPV